MSTRFTANTRKRAHGCELVQTPGSRIVWINHFASAKWGEPQKVRLLKVIETDDSKDWPFLIGVKLGAQRKLACYRWAHIYPSRRAAVRAERGERRLVKAASVSMLNALNGQ